MMEITITERNDPVMKEIRKLYHASFPANERMPFHVLLSRMKDGCRMYALTEKGRFIGFLYVFAQEEVFVYYFAVLPSERGRGYGREALKLLAEKHAGRTIVLEIDRADDPDTPEYRRLLFYLGAGFFRTKIRYRFYGVDYEILASEEDYPKERYVELSRRIWGMRAGAIRYE